MTTTTTGRAHPLSPRAAAASARGRWRDLRELLAGVLILAIWVALWSWVALGVAAPLGRIQVDGVADAAVTRAAEDVAAPRA